MLATSSQPKYAYSSIREGAQHIYQADGLLGFYRGIWPSLFGVSHGAIQFMIYEHLKSCQTVRTIRGNPSPTNVDYLIFGAFSKVIAGSFTYPYQVIRARLQMYNSDKTYRNARDVVTQIWKQEGVSSFYRGLCPNLMRVVPGSCVMFMVYESTRSFLSGLINLPP